MVDYAAVRSAKDEFFRHSPHSPLSPGARDGFAGLDYYPPDPSLVFTVTPEPGDGDLLRLDTSDGLQREYRRAAVATIDVAGSAIRLTLYQSAHPGYFVPFRDATSGRGTYGAGRYLDIAGNEDGTVTIDFNLAYNPYCAYNEAYSCPLPPAENWLPVPITAGERDFVAP